MATVIGELARERSLSGKVAETDSYTRCFLVKTNDPSESLIDISNAPGIKLKSSHPENSAIKAMEYDVKSVDDSGLLYQVSFKYYAMPPDVGEDGGGQGDLGGPEGFSKVPVWSGGSSVSSQAINRDRDGEKIVNSAGDPLEDVTADVAEFRLSLTTYAANSAAWAPKVLEYTNAVNSDQWNGGAPGTWKCQGASAQLVVESAGGMEFRIWELTFEFAYKASGWQLKLMDIGYNELCDEEGTPSASGTKKQMPKGPNNKPIAGPVGLQNGVAVTPPAEPGTLEVNVYQEKPFLALFGELGP